MQEDMRLTLPAAKRPEPSRLSKVIDYVFSLNPGKVAQAQFNPRLAGWFAGRIQIELEGKCDFNEVRALVVERLASKGQEPDLTAEVTNRTITMHKGGHARIINIATLWRLADNLGTQMVRIVSPHSDSDFDHDEDGHASWVVDTSYSAHLKPFHAGDIVTDERGWKGFHEVLKIDPYPYESLRIRLVVKRAGDLVFDDKAF